MNFLPLHVTPLPRKFYKNNYPFHALAVSFNGKGVPPKYHQKTGTMLSLSWG
jgi:hypothetical protein